MTYHNGIGGVRQAMAGVRQAMAGGLGTGFDVSHYGSPYKGMLGLGTASPYTGAPAADPRIVRRYSLLKFTYRPVNVSSAQAANAANLLLAAARTSFAGHTVSKIGTTGWTNDGKVGYQVRLATDTRLGELRSKSYQIGVNVGPRIGTGTSLADAFTDWNPADLIDPVTPGSAGPQGQDAGTPTTTTDTSETISGGLPSWAPWAIAGGGILVVGGIIFAVTRKKPASVTANRRRSRRGRRRSVRRNSHSTSLALQAARQAVTKGMNDDLTVTQTYNYAVDIFDAKMKKARRTPVPYDYQLLKKAIRTEMLEGLVRKNPRKVKSKKTKRRYTSAQLRKMAQERKHTRDLVLLGLKPNTGKKSASVRSYERDADAFNKRHGLPVGYRSRADHIAKYGDKRPIAVRRLDPASPDYVRQTSRHQERFR